VVKEFILECADMESSVTYYARTPVSRDKPSAVYKFYSDKERAPERYTPGEGWVADKNLYLRLMSGVIADDDIVSESEAMRIVKDISGEY
jgi:hypothetical protein